MPIYEYHCSDCRRRSTILQLNHSTPAPVSCSHCGGTNLHRLMSRFSAPKSEEARLEAMADPGKFGDLDENDPKSLAKMMRRMGQEMGEDFGDELDAAMEEAEGEGETAQSDTSGED